MCDMFYAMIINEKKEVRDGSSRGLGRSEPLSELLFKSNDTQTNRFLQIIEDFSLKERFQDLFCVRVYFVRATRSKSLLYLLERSRF